MAIFTNGQPIHDRSKLGAAVPADGMADVVQAHSGG